MATNRIEQKTLFSLLVFCLIALLLNGCGSAQIRRDIKMDMWLGHHSDMLLEDLGEPTEIKYDASSGKVFIYEFSSTEIKRNQKISRKIENLSHNKQGKEADISKEIEPVIVCKFWIDENDIIQEWHRSGSGEKDIDVFSGSAYSRRARGEGRLAGLFGVKGKF